MEGSIQRISERNLAAPQSERAKGVIDRKKWRVLVVDDDREIREIATFALSRSGFEVVVAANEQQLWLQLEQGLPDLIVLDVMMPGRDGYQICHTLHTNAASRAIPVIIMTAHDEDIYARMSAGLGAIHHLTKPFHPLELVERCTLLLRTSIER